MTASRESTIQNPYSANPLPAPGDHRRIIKWMLFVAFLLTVPVPFYMFVVLGFLPTAAIAVMTLRGLLVACLKFTYEAFFMVAIMGAQVVIPGGLLYFVSGVLGRFLCWVLSRRHALLIATMIVVSLMIASGFEIYRLPGHHWMRPANLVGVIGAVIE